MGVDDELETIDKEGRERMVQFGSIGKQLDSGESTSCIGGGFVPLLLVQMGLKPKSC